MELRHLNTFVAVAEEQSFTRASDRLHVVQSAVSASVRTLERELAVALFDRTTHRVELTDAGRALLPEARRTLAAAALAREAVDQVRGGLRGTVTLGVMQAQAMRGVAMASMLAAFRADHLAVDVRVRHTGGSRTMAEEVKDGRLDAAYVALLGSHPGVELLPLTSEPIVLACPRNHRLAARRQVDLSALADEPFADLPQGWGTRMAIDRAFATAGVRRTITFEVNDTASVIEFVRHGLAVAMLAPSFVSESDDLALVAIRRHAPMFDISLAVPANRRLGAAATALVAAARRWAVEGPAPQ